MSRQAQVADLLETLLAEGVQALTVGAAADPPYAEEPPARQVVEHGAVSIDGVDGDNCVELIATWWQRIIPKQNTTNARQQGCTIITQVQLALELRRCSPTIDDSGAFPSAAEETAANLALVRDTQAIWKHLTRLVVRGELFEGVSCDRIQMNNVEPVAPVGGVMGSRIILIVTL